MANVQEFMIVKSEWPNVDGEYLYTITDGVEQKGEFATREEAQEKIERIMLNWRADN